MFGKSAWTARHNGSSAVTPGNRKSWATRDKEGVVDGAVILDRNFEAARACRERISRLSVHGKSQKLPRNSWRHPPRLSSLASVLPDCVRRSRQDARSENSQFVRRATATSAKNRLRRASESASGRIHFATTLLSTTMSLILHDPRRYPMVLSGKRPYLAASCSRRPVRHSPSNAKHVFFPDGFDAEGQRVGSRREQPVPAAEKHRPDRLHLPESYRPPPRTQLLYSSHRMRGKVKRGISSPEREAAYTIRNHAAVDDDVAHLPRSAVMSKVPSRSGAL